MVLKLPGRKLILPNKGLVSNVTGPKLGAPAVHKPVQTTALGLNQQDVTSAMPGFARARSLNEERERIAKQRAARPFEFGMKPNEGGPLGVTAILVDTVRVPQEPHFHFIHRWGHEQKNVKTEVCLQDGTEGCTLCQMLNVRGRYEMVFTCIDSRPYTATKGPNAGKTTPRTKRPYIVTQAMIGQFQRLYNTHKTFRGMVIRCFRDTSKAPSGGSSVEFMQMLPESVLIKYGDLAKPINYLEAYPRLTAAKMQEVYGNPGAGGIIGAEEMNSTDDLPF